MSRIAAPIPPARKKAVLVGCLVIIAVVGLAAAITSRSEDWHPFGLILVLAAFNVASELLSIQSTGPPSGTWVITSNAALVLAMTLLGPAPAAVIGAIGLAADAARRGTPLPDVASNFANYGVFILTGGLLARWLAELWGLTPDDPWFALLFLGIYAYTDAASFLMNAASSALAWGDSLRDQFQREGPWLGAEGPTALLATATAYAYGTVGLGALGLLALVQLTYQYLARNLLISRERADALRQRADELAGLHEALKEHTRQLSELSASRGRLVGQVLQAEENERRRLAEALHHQALQDLVFAQGLAASSDDKPDQLSTALERAVEQLRAAIFDLHPAVLRHAGLSAALHEVADHQAERTGHRPRVEVDPEACGPHDQLLFTLGREQLTNVEKHANATDVALEVVRDNGRVVMEVTDNGCGMDGERRRIALEHGHIGLASGAERVRALGGEFEIDSRPGHGTSIRTTLPVEGI